jgi:hypothetical protein
MTRQDSDPDIEWAKVLVLSEDAQLVFFGDQRRAARLDAFHLDFNDHPGIGNGDMTFWPPTPIHKLCDLLKLPGAV